MEPPKRITPRYRFVPPLLQTNAAQEAHEQYLLDATGLQAPAPGKQSGDDMLASLELNITGITPRLHGENRSVRLLTDVVKENELNRFSSSKAIASYKHKLDHCMNVIKQQRQQLAQLSLHCHRLESHVMEHGTRKQFEKRVREEMQNGADRAAQVRFMKFVPSISSEETVSFQLSSQPDLSLDEIEQQSRLLTQLEDANHQIELLNTRVEVLSQCLTEPNRWHSGSPRRLPDHSQGTNPGFKPQTARPGASSNRSPFRPKAFGELVKYIGDADGIEAFAKRLVNGVKNLTDASSAVVYLIDRSRGDLYCFVSTDSQGDGSRRIKLNQGILGKVAFTEKVINIINCQRDMRYEKLADGNMRSMLCVGLRPNLLAKQGALGLLVAMNKVQGGFFTEDDEGVTSILGWMFSQRYSTWEIAQRANREKLKTHHIFSSAEAMMRIDEVANVIRKLIAKMCTFVGADYAVLFAIDHQQQELVDVGRYSASAEVKLRIPGSSRVSHNGDEEQVRLKMSMPTLVCKSASSGKIRLIHNIATERSFSNAYDEYVTKATNSPTTRSLAIIPLVYQSLVKTVGVLVLGKLKGDGFDDADLDHISDFKDLTCVAVARLNAMDRKSRVLQTNLTHIDELVNDLMYGQQEEAEKLDTFMKDVTLTQGINQS